MEEENEEIMVRHPVTYFYADTGEIFCTTDAWKGKETEGMREGFDWIPGLVDGGVSRIDPITKEVLPLLEFDTPDEVISTISNLPVGTRAIFNGEGEVVDDGELTLVGSHGFETVITVHLTCALYLPKLVQVTCPEE